jgi:hypothetical protein
MYGFQVTKPGVSVQSSTPKDRVIDSEIPCLKILQSGKRDFVINNGATVTYEESIFTSLPFLPLIYLYEPSVSRYKPATSIGLGSLSISFEFTATKLYVTITNGTGAQVTSHYYWFIGYS